MKHLTQADFESTVASAEPVFVEFGADWCGPCKQLEPLLERLDGDPEFGASIYKLDIGEESEIANQHRIMSVPMVKLFLAGEVIAERVSPRTVEDLQAMLALAS